MANIVELKVRDKCSSIVADTHCWICVLYRYYLFVILFY